MDKVLITGGEGKLAYDCRNLQIGKLFWLLKNLKWISLIHLSSTSV